MPSVYDMTLHGCCSDLSAICSIYLLAVDCLLFLQVDQMISAAKEDADHSRNELRPRLPLIRLRVMPCCALP